MGVPLGRGERLYGLAAAFLRLGVRGVVDVDSVSTGTWVGGVRGGGVTSSGDRLGVGEGRVVSAPAALSVSISMGGRRLMRPWNVCRNDWRTAALRWLGTRRWVAGRVLISNVKSTLSDCCQPGRVRERRGLAGTTVVWPPTGDSSRLALTMSVPTAATSSSSGMPSWISTRVVGARSSMADLR